jgi:hypothetical protein
VLLWSYRAFLYTTPLIMLSAKVSVLVTYVHFANRTASINAGKSSTHKQEISFDTAALRYRSHRIIFGEAHRSEPRTLIDAMKTGHRGTVCSVFRRCTPAHCYARTTQLTTTVDETTVKLSEWRRYDHNLRPSRTIKNRPEFAAVTLPAWATRIVPAPS